MPEPTLDASLVNPSKTTVLQDLKDARLLAKTIGVQGVRSGEWFFKLLAQLFRSYDKNGRAAYFRRKYPGLPPDDIAEILISVTTKVATIGGGVAGLAVTADEIAAVLSAGATVAIAGGTIGAEMLFLSYIQMRLVLDLATLYGVSLDADDPEDMLMIFGYALGIAPTNLLGRGAQLVAKQGSKAAVRAVVSKGTLKAVQTFGRRLGVKILQRTVLKFAVPLSSAAVGSTYNYVTTRSIGRIASAHFRNLGLVTDEIRRLFARQETYDVAVPAAMLFAANASGAMSPEEIAFYKATVKKMTFVEEDASAAIEELAQDEGAILRRASTLAPDLRAALIELIVLMAIYDGALSVEERLFLAKAAQQLGVPLDLSAVERRAAEYHAIVEKNFFEEKATAAGAAVVEALGATGRAAKSMMKMIGDAAKRGRHPPTAESAPSAEERMRKLKGLWDSELISSADFSARKAEILSGI